MPEPHSLIKFADLTTPGARPENTSLRTILLELPQGRGFVFGIVEVQHRDDDLRERIVHVIASNLEGLKADLANDGNVPRRFEAMLVRLNADLNRLGSDARMSLRKLKSVIGVMTESQVFLSGIGFLHRTAERRYVIYELDQQFNAPSDEQQWDKPFLTVLDGELHPGDVLYIGTRIPPHALSLNDLQDILITLPPAGALERAQQFVPANCRYGALCFHVSEEDRSGPPKKANPIVSLASFEETKSRTADLLGEQTPDFVSKARAAADHLRKRLSSPGNRSVGTILKRILQLVIASTVAIATFIGRMFGRVNARVRAGNPTTLLARGWSGARNAWERLLRAQKTVKITIAVVAVLAITLTVTLYESKSSRLAKEAQAAYQTTIDKVEEKRVAAEASIIYNNTRDAQVAVNDALALLATLPQDDSTFKTTITDLKAQLTTLLEKTRGITQVNPEQIASMTSGTLSQFVNVNGTLYGLTGDFTPYRLNELNRALELVDVGTSPLSGAVTSTNENADILAVDFTKRLGRISLTSRTVSPLTSGVNGLASVEDISSYNGNLYVLAAASQQIVKMRPQGLGYEAGTTWITALESDITEASAIAVDGNMYVLVGSTIVRLKSGRENPWDHAPIDPALSSPRDMWTSTESPYLYILDSSGRVVVLEKESGKLVTQYTSDTLNNAVGFAVLEHENRIVVATTNAVLSYTATHLLK
ncbi:MAG: hypothetical protein UY72_C0067G0009 [Candidatus Uhrbacteria bacterium GW2011_GWD2_52_7]|uniref:Uncharacterized protein n=1 Tax=Candidatus Uhrbacteria bacterium GW2011_GWD2_52_7 TaxID=1618989 RepID=A0A0G1XCL0_9BACT|nr:MAG: hypothetical protein UY72_C0067G0009 [Candidatus Uhrbacteria bacterium GW2011_GWD2_52_7]